MRGGMLSRTVGVHTDGAMGAAAPPARSTRTLRTASAVLGTAAAITVAAVVAVVGLGCLLATPAQARGGAAKDGVWVQVSPSTVTAGYRVTVTASCVDNKQPRSMSSRAFPSPVRMRPVHGLLQATVIVPKATQPQGYTVTVVCDNRSTATTTIWVVSMATPTKGPATGGGGTAGSGGGGTVALGGGLAALTAGVGLGVVAARRSRTARS